MVTLHFLFSFSCLYRWELNYFRYICTIFGTSLNWRLVNLINPNQR